MSVLYGTMYRIPGKPLPVALYLLGGGSVALAFASVKYDAMCDVW